MVETQEEEKIIFSQKYALKAAIQGDIIPDRLTSEIGGTPNKNMVSFDMFPKNDFHNGSNEVLGNEELHFLGVGYICPQLLERYGT